VKYILSLHANIPATDVFFVVDQLDEFIQHSEKVDTTTNLNELETLGTRLKSLGRLPLKVVNVMPIA
jgi:hypothetical protein